MNKKIIVGIVFIISILLLVSGVVMFFTSDNTRITPAEKEKQTISEELYNTVKQKLDIQDDSLVYIKTVENKYYFNRLDNNKEIIAEIIYDSENDSLSLKDKNDISEGTTEPGSGYTGPTDPNDKVN